jgi:hypothetical protein
MDNQIDELYKLDRPERLERVLLMLLGAVSRRESATCRRLLGKWWSDFEGGLNRNSRSIIVGAFREAGFISDDQGVLAPEEPLTLYRGSTSSRRSGLSWTSDVGKARWFANRQNLLTRRLGFVYEAKVSPAFILGYFNQRGENEWVVDPAGLVDIRRAVDAAGSSPSADGT